ncbi:MAG: low molecular weight protein-tyrosine-phosphatase [Cellvibrionales bacterium]
MVAVLFVCLGNICRSPTAEGVFRGLCESRGVGEQIRVDSAGTGDWHVGNPPDSRAIAAAARRGIDLSLLRARQVRVADFQEFDFVMAMDSSNLRDLALLQPQDSKAELSRWLSWAGSTVPGDVPDPYYGGDGGFEKVLDLVEEASQGFLAHLVSSGKIVAS